MFGACRQRDECAEEVTSIVTTHPTKCPPVPPMPCHMWCIYPLSCTGNVDNHSKCPTDPSSGPHKVLRTKTLKPTFTSSRTTQKKTTPSQNISTDMALRYIAG